MRHIKLDNLRMTARFAFHPLLFAAFMRQPKLTTEDTVTTLDEWLTIDERHTNIVVKILGCKCPQSHKNQQRENMAIRKKFARTFGEWRALEGPSKKTCTEEIKNITTRYEKERQCHRTFACGSISVRCYCDEHAH